MSHRISLRRFVPAAAIMAGFGLSLLIAAAEPAGGRLTSRARPAVTPAKPVPIGEEVRTDATQRRRLLLADGSVVYVHDDAEVKVTGERRLRLSRGEVFVE